DPRQIVLAALGAEARRAHLWQEIGELPPRQRAALLLGMASDELLLVAGAVSPVAGALGLPLAGLIALWPSLPLSRPALAARLEATLLQVSNLRKCARERLARRIEKLER